MSARQDDAGLVNDEAPPRRRHTRPTAHPRQSQADEDRPESWGERADSDADRLAYYEAQRPPHHGG